MIASAATTSQPLSTKEAIEAYYGDEWTLVDASAKTDAGIIDAVMSNGDVTAFVTVLDAGRPTTVPCGACLLSAGERAAKRTAAVQWMNADEGRAEHLRALRFDIIVRDEDGLRFFRDAL